MTLASGARLGPYEILSPLGAGGMGEVYKARDTRLSRDVAVKVLPSDVVPTPEARQRFEREARMVSQLSHPNICALYDVGREGRTEYLVMELLEGQTLSHRLARAPLPLEQAVLFGAEIASALEAAHRKGIVHRDLKPANVMLTKAGLKLLDFGLARVFDKHEPIVDLTAAATVGNELTAEGVIVGTVPYMAPEQLRGGETDARTDVFALGAVLYEMATGRRAFLGKDQATLISAIMTSEPPPISELQPISPAGLDRLVRTCLAKDPGDRWQSAHDIELQLRAMGTSGLRTAAGAAAVPGRRRAAWLAWAAAAAAGAAITAATLLWGRDARPPTPSPIRFSILPPEGGEFGYQAEGIFLVVSPDGTQLAYVAAEANKPQRIWLRPLSSLEAKPIAGTEGAGSIMWSPDGRSIGFFTSDKLKRVDLAGGAAVPICDVPPGGGGKAGTWGRTDILFTSIQGGALYRVPASGGQPVTTVKMDAGHAELRLAWPLFLPDGESYLYLVRERQGWGDLMFVERGRAPRAVTRLSSFFQYVEPGYLVYSRESTLVAQAFDWKRGRLLGEPLSVAEHVRYFYSTASAAFGARGTTIAYQARGNTSRLAWFDRTGKEVGALPVRGDYLDVWLAPDGKRLLFDRTRPGLETFHVWSHDLERGVETPMTNGLDTEAFPRLLADGTTLIYSVVRGTPPILVRRDLATGKEELLVGESRAFQMAQDVSPDGRTLLYSERGETGPFDLWSASLDGVSKPVPVLQSPFEKNSARFSPDGRYVAFISNESGRPEAYVMPFPGPGEKVRVSEGGPWGLRWGRNGELFYATIDGRFVVTPIRTTPTLQIGASTTLFQIKGRSWIDFDVSADSRRFLVIVPEAVGDESPLQAVAHWSPGAASP